MQCWINVIRPGPRQNQRVGHPSTTPKLVRRFHVVWWRFHVNRLSPKCRIKKKAFANAGSHVAYPSDNGVATLASIILIFPLIHLIPKEYTQSNLSIIIIKCSDDLLKKGFLIV